MTLTATDAAIAIMLGAGDLRAALNGGTAELKKLDGTVALTFTGIEATIATAGANTGKIVMKSPDNAKQTPTAENAVAINTVDFKSSEAGNAVLLTYTTEETATDNAIPIGTLNTSSDYQLNNVVCGLKEGATVTP